MEPSGKCKFVGNFIEPNPNSTQTECLEHENHLQASNQTDQGCSCDINKKNNVESLALEEEHAPLPKQLPNYLDKSDFSLPEDSATTPCYMPQAGDFMPSTDSLDPMGPIGPWATGKPDWSPISGLTGTRPVVDRYSITRFSTNEWRQRNRDLLLRTFNVFENANKNDSASKNIVLRTNVLVCKTQQESSKKLKDRAHLVHKWKSAIAQAIAAMAEELTTLEEQRLRLKQSLSILRTPESIASECIERRSTRPETELIRDKPEEELVKELALIAEIRMLLYKTLADIDIQQTENRAARNRLEYDWSDKKDAYEIESLNVALSNHATTALFHPGATRFPDEQSSEEYWMHFTHDTITECENTRFKSVQLRNSLDAILLNAARDLRSQADGIEKAFTIRIGCMTENLNRLEMELKDCLRKLAETETRIEKITQGIEGLDSAMRVAQTRLDNRNFRPHVENCRDRAQLGLVEEVKTIQDGISALSLSEAEKVKISLMTIRGDLEREIMLKRRALMIDRDRCMLLRSLFPSANALSGNS